MTQNEIAAKAKELRELQSLIDEAQQEAETIRDELKVQMGAQEELHAGEYKITWKAITSARLDTAALKKALPDVFKTFSRTTTTRRFVVA